MSEKKKQYATLLSVLAHASTNDARQLLLTNTGEKAVNKQDLEQKLAKMYAQSTHKVDLERQMAEIHPHRDFLLKYLKKVEVQPIQTQTPADTLTKYDVGVEKTITIAEPVSQADGVSCGCNCCRGSVPKNEITSNAEGDTQVRERRTDTALVIGMVSIVAILGMVIILKNRQ